MKSKDYTPADNDWVGVRPQQKCACGHQRRVHAVKRDSEKNIIEYGQCLGGTPMQPMSCECTGFGE